MFTDGRSKKVIFLAHCLLNQNAISDGTAVCPAAKAGLRSSTTCCRRAATYFAHGSSSSQSPLHSVSA